MGFSQELRLVVVRLSVINVRHFRFLAPVCQLALIRLTAFHTISSPFSMSLQRIKAFVYMVVIMKPATGNQIRAKHAVMRKILKKATLTSIR